ncbi:Replication factor A, C-terminal [Dillenia turbinata]|uniref:Replication factor A, C-terminal n=1 Tax=Dillenia turbinata TaxID=194707 RepID=A0AAN8UV27_9MAGN
MTTVPIDKLRNDDQPWVATIIVEEKLNPIQSMKSPTKIHKVIFSDVQGAKVEGIMFNRAIDTMASKLQPYKKYRISNAEIREIKDPKYRPANVFTQWNFVFLTYLHARTDIIGIVVKAFLVKAVPTKYGPTNVQKYRFEVNLSDKSGVITATLFGEIAEQILGLTVTENMKIPSKMHIDHIHSSLETKEYIIQIKLSKQKGKESQQKYSIVYCVEHEDVEKSSNLLTYPVCESSGASVLKEQGLNIHQYTTNVILPLVSQGNIAMCSSGQLQYMNGQPGAPGRLGGRPGAQRPPTGA